MALTTMQSLIIGLILALTGGVFAFAENSAPGDALYKVKVSVNEPVAGVFAVSTEAKAEWHERLIERRLGEAVDLAAKNSLDPGKISEIENLLKDHIHTFAANIKDLASDTRKEIRSSELTARLEAAFIAHQNVLRGLSQGGSAVEISVLLARMNEYELKIKGDREILDAKLGNGLSVMSEGGGENGVTKEGAVSKQKAAEYVLASAMKIYDREKGRFSSATRGKIDALFADARNNLAEGKAKITSGEYPDAMEKLQKVVTFSNKARVVALSNSIAGEIDEDLGVGFGDMDEDNDVGDIGDDNEDDDSSPTVILNGEDVQGDQKQSGYNDGKIFKDDDSEDD